MAIRTYFDQNCLQEEVDRRLHAADMELAGGRIQVVPAIIERLAPAVHVGAWGWSETQLKQTEMMLEATAENRNKCHRIRNLRQQRWWCGEWKKNNGLYWVHELNQEEQAIAEALVGPGGMPKDCFPRAEDGPLGMDNDANIVAQTIAVGGTLIITGNMVMVEDDQLHEWMRRTQNQWPVRHSQGLVQRVDKLYREWWSHPQGPTELTKSVIGAHWPADENAETDEVMAGARRGAAAMSRGHFKKFGPILEAHLQKTDVVVELVQDVRKNLPARMRKAERERRMIMETGEKEEVRKERGSGQKGRREWGYHW